MSDENDSHESTKRQVLADWSHAVLRASDELLVKRATQARHGVVLSKAENQAHWLVTRLALLCAGGRPIDDMEQGLLERVAEALTPAGSGKQAVLAVAIVERHVGQYQAAEGALQGTPVALIHGIGYRSEDGQLRRAPKQAVALELIDALTEFVHEDFWSLKESLAEVEEVLSRWHPEPRKLGPKAKGRLATNALLEELNNLAGKPLGADNLSARSIANARRDERDT